MGPFHERSPEFTPRVVFLLLLLPLLIATLAIVDVLSRALFARHAQPTGRFRSGRKNLSTAFTAICLDCCHVLGAVISGATNGHGNPAAAKYH